MLKNKKNVIIIWFIFLDYSSSDFYDESSENSQDEVSENETNDEQGKN